VQPASAAGNRNYARKAGRVQPGLWRNKHRPEIAGDPTSQAIPSAAGLFNDGQRHAVTHPLCDARTFRAAFKGAALLNLHVSRQASAWPRWL